MQPERKKETDQMLTRKGSRAKCYISDEVTTLEWALKNEKDRENLEQLISKHPSAISHVESIYTKTARYYVCVVHGHAPGLLTAATEKFGLEPGS